MAGNSGKAGISVASRLLAVLGAFDADHRALSLSDISRRSGVPLTTAHRLVGELTRHDALVRRPSGEYVIGQLLWSLGLLAPSHAGLREVAAPFLHDVYAVTLATVHLAVRDETEVLYLERLSGPQTVPVVSRVGGRLPLHTTGVGKVLLAHAPVDVQREVLEHLTKPTRYSITEPGRIGRELSTIRRDGYAQTHSEMSLGACSVAVPIMQSGTVVAAIGVVVPSLRTQKTRLLTALRVAAQGINRNLTDFH